ETQLPPLKDLGGGHRSLCWLSDEVLATMEPVIDVGSGGDKDAAAMPPPADAPHRAAVVERMPEQPVPIAESDVPGIADADGETTPAQVIAGEANRGRRPAQAVMREAGDSAPE